MEKGVQAAGSGASMQPAGREKSSRKRGSDGGEVVMEGGGAGPNGRVLDSKGAKCSQCRKLGLGPLTCITCALGKSSVGGDSVGTLKRGGSRGNW